MAATCRRELPLTLSGRHWRRRSSDKSQPSKAAPSSAADRDRTSWDDLARLACRRRTLLRQLDAPRRRPQLSKAWRVYRRRKRKERLFELDCEIAGGRGINEQYQHIPLSFRGASQRVRAKRAR